MMLVASTPNFVQINPGAEIAKHDTLIVKYVESLEQGTASQGEQPLKGDCLSRGALCDTNASVYIEGVLFSGPRAEAD